MYSQGVQPGCTLRQSQRCAQLCRLVQPALHLVAPAPPARRTPTDSPKSCVAACSAGGGGRARSRPSRPSFSGPMEPPARPRPRPPFPTTTPRSSFAESVPELAAQYAVPHLFRHDVFACLGYRREDYRRGAGWGHQLPRLLGPCKRRCPPSCRPCPMLAPPAMLPERPRGRFCAGRCQCSGTAGARSPHGELGTAALSAHAWPLHFSPH